MSLAVRVIPCLDVDAGRVVKGVNFVDEAPTDLFFVAFEDIFKLFHGTRLDYNLVRL